MAENEKLSARWNRRGMIAGKLYARRQARSYKKLCRHCGGMIFKGSLFWRRHHIDLHIECFEELQRQANLAKARVTGGRKPVLDTEKEKEIDRLHDRGTSPRDIAHHIGVSKRTVIRYLKGRYHPAKLENTSSIAPASV